MKSFKENVNLHMLYMADLPMYLQFFIFLKRGWYNGHSWTIRWARVKCFFDKHEFPEYKYYKWKDGIKTNNYHKQCKHCGACTNNMV